MSQLPIGEYALLSDCHSAALVSREGSIDWLCFPRFDSPSTFGRLLDPRAGFWSLRPSGMYSCQRTYRPQTMILETTFTHHAGAVRVVDAMALGPKERGHQLGTDSPGTVLRQLEGLEGEVELELEFSPRPEYGLVHPLFKASKGGVHGQGGAHRFWLSTSIPLEPTGFGARARFTVRKGETVGFALQHRAAYGPPPRHMSQRSISKRLEDTTAAWCTWADLHQAYEGPWRDLVHHSGRVLQALTFQPTGAIVAAATTSLPETEGGERNWDYRYTWVRDASLTLEALWVAACPDEAYRFFDFLAAAAHSQITRGVDLQIMFGVGGEHDLYERELPHLQGWRDSRPVRVGNAAWSQRQIDVYGELLGAVHKLSEQLRDLDKSTREFLVDVAETAGARWREQDQGIWEMRGEPRDFLYSKLMCWVALDRAIRVAPLLRAERHVDRWKNLCAEIRTAILQYGWSDKAHAFTQSFGSDALDASNLMMPIVGFLRADDPRMRATIQATADRLTDRHGLVYRYRAHDGLEGEEGTFLLCTFWLAQAQALAGQRQDARQTFERAASFANDVGLLAEEVNPDTRELLGNYPQAFSHIGLVNAAWAINQLEAQPGAEEHPEAPLT